MTEQQKIINSLKSKLNALGLVELREEVKKLEVLIKEKANE